MLDMHVSSTSSLLTKSETRSCLNGSPDCVLWGGEASNQRWKWYIDHPIKQPTQRTRVAHRLPLHNIDVELNLLCVCGGGSIERLEKLACASLSSAAASHPVPTLFRGVVRQQVVQPAPNQPAPDARQPQRPLPKTDAHGHAQGLLGRERHVDFTAFISVCACACVRGIEESGQCRVTFALRFFPIQPNQTHRPGPP